MEHLKESIRHFALAPKEERINKILNERWIGYTRGKNIIEKLDKLLIVPKTHRMPNLLIIGETNNGKTVLINRFFKSHQPKLSDDEDGVQMPVVLLQAPPIPDEKRLYNEILKRIGAPYRINDRVDKKQFQVIEMLGNLNVKMLIIDEIHNILAGTMARQRSFLNVIKYLANELQIPIVGVGTKDAFNAIHTDPQLSNRFEPMTLPKWEMNDEYLRLLMSFESLIPLQKPSYLDEDSLASKILYKSEGTIGEISEILCRSAIFAIENGTEKITKKIIDSIDYISPSDRRNRKEILF